VRHLIRVLAAVGALACAVALPFAPVMSDSTTVVWDANRDGPATTALFVPYRPAELSATVPCASVRSALVAPGPTVVLGTAPVTNPRNGLVVVSERGRLTALIDERGFPLAVPGGAGCGLDVRSTLDRTSISVGGVERVSIDGDVVPEVFGLRTDAPVNSGVRVSAQTRTWFESTPTDLKEALLAGYASLAIIALLTVIPRPRRWRLARPGGTLQGWGRTGVRLLVDTVVLATLALWTVVGPLTDDDGFATMTIRNDIASGDIGNYYRWFNASEAPFTLMQTLVEPLIQITLAPPILRLPSMLAGVLAWFVISRGVLGAALPSLARSGGGRALAAVAFLAWWLPFNLGMRPEPWVALGTAATLALLLRMRSRPPDRRALFLATGAAVTAGLTIAVTPTGLLVAVPVVLFTPALLRVVRGPEGTSPPVRWVGSAGRLALLGAGSAVALAVMFADQTLTGALRATEIHSEFGPNLGWYEEWFRYQALLGTGQMGSAAKRLPVLLTLALLVVAAVLLGRRLRGVADLPGTAVLTAVAAGAFGVLWLMPSKWTHHFGALAGFGAPFLVAATVLALRSARRHGAVRGVLVTCSGGAVLVCGAVALAFSGPNTWSFYSDYGMPWSAEPVRPAGVPLNSPALWLALAVAMASVVWLIGLARRRAARAAAATGAASASGLVSVAAMIAAVALLVGSFGTAPLRLQGTYSLAEENLRAVLGTSCGLEEHVEVLPAAPGGVLRPVAGADSRTGFVTGGGFPPAIPPTDPPGVGHSTFLWGSFVTGPGTTGSLVSGWFDLPPQRPDTEVSVELAGRPAEGNALTLDFGRIGPNGAVEPLGSRRLQDPAPGLLPFDDPVNGRPDDWRDYSYWRTLGVAAEAVPAGAEVVRVRATDWATDPQGWLAVTGPVVRDVVSLTEYLDGTGPVLIDWPMSFAFPCRTDFPKIHDGVAQTPEVTLASPRDYPPAGLSYDPEVGGSFAAMPLTGSAVEVPSRLVGLRGREWGRLIRTSYPARIDSYSTTTTTQRSSGWESGHDYPFD